MQATPNPNPHPHPNPNQATKLREEVSSLKAQLKKGRAYENMVHHLAATNPSPGPSPSPSPNPHPHPNPSPNPDPNLR